jgi:catechol 2,3-dioxygenase-like lactoylglutathione lyase family enzyme
LSSPLDHVVIAVHDLDAAIQDYRALGFTVMRGGIHANRATQNALIAFPDATYLELLAPTGEPPLSGVIDFSVLLQQGEGLAGYALRSKDIEADVRRLRAEGFAVDEVIPGERRRNDGLAIQWKLALLDGGFSPFLIQDVTPREWRISQDPAVTTHANRVVGVRGIEIAVRDLMVSRDRYARLLGLSPQRESLDARAIESIVLREAGDEIEHVEILFAVHLLCERASDEHFPLERTHDVRFQQFTHAD